MIKAVIDTNVLVSGLWTHDQNAPTKRILDALLVGDFVCLLSDEILTEYIDVLNRDKFNFNKEDVSRLIEHIERFGKKITPERSGDSFPDPDDRIFYEVTLSVPDARLVTGNQKHFPISPIVVTPAQFCEMIGIPHISPSHTLSPSRHS